jgi:hypothetical protein
MIWLWNNCKPVINYDGINLSFSGLETEETIHFKLAEFKINKEIIQAATDIAKIYDLFRVANCTKANPLP